MIQNILCMVGIAAVALWSPAIGSYIFCENAGLNMQGRICFVVGVLLICQKFLF